MMAKHKKRNKKKNKNGSIMRLIGSVVFILIATIAGYYIVNESHRASEADTHSLELAIPESARGSESQVIEHIGYTVSYNQKRRNPDWVAYELTSDEAKGKEPRNGDFIPDPEVKGAQATDEDYRRSGWDRGHLAPAADMKWSGQAMRESFYLSNISPQNNNLNRGVWKSIEELTRDVAIKYNKVLVVTGPVFNSKKGKGTIGKNKVMIPDAFYKVLLINDNGYKGIGFYCGNVAGKKKLDTYARSIDEIEKITGIDFFHKLPDEIEDKVESRYDWSVWE